MKFSLAIMFVCALHCASVWADGKIYSNLTTSGAKSGAGAGVIVFPDVEKVPSAPSGFVPIPYPNVYSERPAAGAGRDLSGTVKIKGEKAPLRTKRVFTMDNAPHNGQPYYLELPDVKVPQRR